MGSWWLKGIVAAFRLPALDGLVNIVGTLQIGLWREAGTGRLMYDMAPIFGVYNSFRMQKH
jgi:hypothetical protein